MQVNVTAGLARSLNIGVLSLSLSLFMAAVHAAPSSTPPAWVSSVSPGTWSAISQNTMLSVDPEDDPALNPNHPNFNEIRVFDTRPMLFDSRLINKMI